MRVPAGSGLSPAAWRRRPSWWGVDERQVELAGEGRALGPAGEHRLGAEVDGQSPDVGALQDTADAVAGLQDGDGRRSAREVAGGDEPGQAAPTTTT